MKKALSLLLVLCMLATLCTVPVFAEDEILDLPVIEEVTEEVMEEEVELFADEVTEGDPRIADIETTADDDFVLLADIEGAKLAYKKVASDANEGDIKYLTDGQKTVGTDTRTLLNGFMGRKGDYFTIDLGEKMAFSGIRVWESSRVRYLGVNGADGTGATPRPAARRFATARTQFSDDGITWYTLAAGTATYNDENYTGDIPFAFSSKGGVTNIEAQYIRLEATSFSPGWGEFELEEIAMIKPKADLNTWSLTGYEIPVSTYESVTMGSGDVGTKAYDNNLSLNTYWHGDHTIADATDAHRTVTIKFKEKTAIGGIRLWPRNDGTKAAPVQNGASMARYVKFEVSEDGDNWERISVDIGNDSVLSANGYAAPVDYIIPPTVSVETTYLRIVGLKINKYVILPEFQIFTSGIQAEKKGYVAMDDVVELNTMPVVLTGGDTYDGNWKNVTTNPFSGFVQQLVNKNEDFYVTTGGDPHMENNFVYFDGFNNSTDVGGPNEAWYDIDLGKAYTFSAVRLFSRWNQVKQSITKGYILVSDNGTDWYRADLFEDSYKDVSGMAKYNSTGDCYTDIPANFGGNKNITARYIRIHCVMTGGGDHWSWQQMMLVKPIEANETNTVTELIADMQADAAEVEAKIAAIPAEIKEVSEEVVVARKAYDALCTLAKTYVSEASLAALTKGEVANTGLVYSLTTNSNTGLKKATFTLPKRDVTEIKSVTYTDTFGKDHDGKAATTVAVDGDYMTITIAGDFTVDEGLTSYSNGKTTYIHNDTKSHYGWTKGDTVDPKFFTGFFAREVASDGFGDHFVEVTFEDDVTYIVNIKTTPAWATLTSAKAIEGGEYTDEITPKTTWKSTTTNMNNSLNSAFDGKVEYLIRKGGDTKTGNRYESDYIAGNIVKPDGTTTTQVLAYNPVRMDFAIDMGEATEISGARIYPRVSSYNVDKTKGTTAGCPTMIRYYGSNDGKKWENLGDFTFTTDLIEKTADFGKNVSYRYYRASIRRANGGEYRHTVSISELTFIKPKTYLVSEDTVDVDKSELQGASFEFALAGGEGIKSFTTAAGGKVPFDADVSGKKALVTIAGADIAKLSRGAHNLVLTLTNGQVFNLTLNVYDHSQVGYAISTDGAGTSALVLTSTSGKEVSKITVDGVEVTPFKGTKETFPAFTVSEDNKTITIPRYNFRKLVDLYAKLGLAEDATATVPVVVTYADETTKTYTVTLSATWVATAAIKGTFAEDEVLPVAGEWKVRTSSANTAAAHPRYAFTEVLHGKRDAQNWHTAYTFISPDAIQDTNMDHYIDVDFGSNPPEFSGVRVTERMYGSTYDRIVISGKNSDSDAWEVFYDGPAGAVAPKVNNLMFEKIFNCRYMRMQFNGKSSHVTVDTIHLIKDVARLESDATVVTDINEGEKASFTFYVPAGATFTGVAIGDEAVDAANYTFENGVLTFNADFVGTLGESTTLKVTIGATAFDVTIERVDIYAASYVIVDGVTTRGTNDLVLKLPEGKVPTGITYGDKTIAVNPEKNPVELVAGEGTLTIKRYVIRNLDDIFDKTEMKITVNFSDETSKEYTVTLTKEGKALTGLNTEAFLEDEILPAEGAWTITASPSHGVETQINYAFAKLDNDTNWHSAYTVIKNAAGEDEGFRDATTNRLYIDVNFGAETSIGGIRYYERKNHDSGLWNGVSIYGKDATGNWVLIKSQSFDTEALKGVAAGVVDVYFKEMVKYTEVRIIIDASNLATAHAITFLNKIPAPVIPEDKVNVQVTPSTGGNVTVNNVPTQGDNYVDANQEVTFEATPDATGEGVGFMYWVEANTGKILGKDTSLTVKATSGKDIKAVFADPASFEVFVSFFGRNANSVIAHSYVKKGEAPKIPSNDKLYTTGYEFKYWTNADGVEMDMTETVDANTEFYAFYEAKTTKQSKITVVGGKVRLNNNGDTAKTEATYAYDTAVKVIANDPADGEKFSHWEIAGKIVSYDKVYRFYAPDADITVTAVFVASDAVVEEEINITMTKTLDSINGVAVASFLTTRYVPSGVEVLETGVIYVKDASYGDLTIADIGKTSANGKAVKVATCDKTTSGQYKLTASYAEFGIKAVGFITYIEDRAVKTIYTEEIEVDGTSAN